MDSLWCTALKSPQSWGKKGGILKKDVSAWVPNINMASNPHLSSRTRACVILNCGWLQTAFLWIISNLKSSWRKPTGLLCPQCHRALMLGQWRAAQWECQWRSPAFALIAASFTTTAGSTAVLFSIWWEDLSVNIVVPSGCVLMNGRKVFFKEDSKGKPLNDGSQTRGSFNN